MIADLRAHNDSLLDELERLRRQVEAGDALRQAFFASATRRQIVAAAYDKAKGVE